MRLPPLLLAPVERLAADLLRPPEGMDLDFAAPPGEPALVPPDSVSWRVFSNPAVLFIGGVAAVLLELAEPRVRHGVWDHSGFRTDPLLRLRRTGLAAMMSVYGPASAARAMIEGVNRAHARIAGVTDRGVPYRAHDPELLDWVQATAAWGFLTASTRYVRPLSRAERDAYYAEGKPVAALYGATGAPDSEAALDRLFARFEPLLEPSATLDEFLGIMAKVKLLPGPAGPVQKLLIAAAIDVLPPRIAAGLGLAGRGLAPWQRPLVRTLARTAARLPLRNAPPAQACRRLGLVEDWPYREA